MTHPPLPSSLCPSPSPSPPLSNPLHPKKFFFKNCQVFIFQRTDNDVDFSVPFLSDHSHFFLPFLSLSLHIPFPSVSIRCQSISARGEVKEHQTFLLKLVLFSLFSFTHLVLLWVFLYSISDWFTLIHFLLFLSLSLTSISLTHSRACTIERTLILHLYILLWNELTVCFVSHFTNSLRIVHIPKP